MIGMLMMPVTLLMGLMSALVQLLAQAAVSAVTLIGTVVGLPFRLLGGGKRGMRGR